MCCPPPIILNRVGAIVQWRGSIARWHPGEVSPRNRLGSYTTPCVSTDSETRRRGADHRKTVSRCIVCRPWQAFRLPQRTMYTPLSVRLVGLVLNRARPALPPPASPPPLPLTPRRGSGATRAKFSCCAPSSRRPSGERRTAGERDTSRRCVLPCDEQLGRRPHWHAQLIA